MMINIPADSPSAAQDLLRLLDHCARRLTLATGMSFERDKPGMRSPLGRSLRNALRDIRVCKFNEANYELTKIDSLSDNLELIDRAKPALAKSYRRRIRKSSPSEYYGIRFEIDIAASLIYKGVEFEVPKHRPDFVVSNPAIQIECGSVRVIKPFLDGKDLSYKLESCVRKKSGKPYTGRSTALFVDCTNLVFHGGATAVERLRRAAKLLETSSPFGCVAGFNWVADNDTDRYRLAYSRTDHAEVSNDLQAFLNQCFPRLGVQIRNYLTPREG